MHISLLRPRITIHPARKTQMALLLVKKVTVPAKYLDFADVFLQKSVNVVLEQTWVNEHAIKLEEGKQLPYGPIYSLGLVEFKTLKIYIKMNLVNNFIKASKSPVGAPILFVRNLNSSFCLYVNYWGLNNLIIQNWYPLPLIGGSLNWFSQAKQFTQLDFTYAYHWMRIKEGNKQKTVL